MVVDKKRKKRDKNQEQNHHKMYTAAKHAAVTSISSSSSSYSSSSLSSSSSLKLGLTAPKTLVVKFGGGRRSVAKIPAVIVPNGAFEDGMMQLTSDDVFVQHKIFYSARAETPALSFICATSASDAVSGDS